MLEIENLATEVLENLTKVKKDRVADLEAELKKATERSAMAKPKSEPKQLKATRTD